MAEVSDFISGYSDVGGLSMYYEVYGEGRPLVLIHGGGSTIQTSFGNIIPLLSRHRKVVAMELQAHGRTRDREAPLSFEQDADDIARLLKNLGIPHADVLGFSNGGQTALEFALRHRDMLGKVVFASTFFRRDAAVPEFWNGFHQATLDMMPQALRDGFLLANPNRRALQKSFEKDVRRMIDFKGWTDAQVSAVTIPALIINGNNDVGSAEHALWMHRTLKNAELVILPGGHGTYLGSIESQDGEWTMSYTAAIIETFLDKP